MNTSNNNKQLNIGFIHRFEPAYKYDNDESKERKKPTMTLLLLHGTGGNEDDLIPVGQMLSSNAALLSPRGKVLENGLPRFFMRLSEGIFDLEDLRFRTQELAKFVKEASIAYSFDLNKTIAIGFSNGANIAASLLLSNPETIKGAILFRAMIPFIPHSLPDLSHKHVLLSAGLADPIVPKEQVDGLLRLFEDTRSNITLKLQLAGHNLTDKDILDAKEWLENLSF
ncbi:alpha/beta hydrolase [soil metagenome]